MALVVQKYGGSSVQDADRIRKVAEPIVRTHKEGNDVVVVVSAMGHTTDELLAMAHDIATVPDPRELDMLLTAGERIAMSLLGIAINAPIAEIRRLFVAPDGTLLYVAEASYRGDYVHLEIDLLQTRTPQ